MNRISNLPPAVFLMGPTASGKTRIAVDLAARHGFEIISVDSAQIYNGMDIGTGTPDSATLSIAPHHLINIIDPVVSYSAARFREDALALMQDITCRGRIPLLTGGTMLYFKALRDGLSPLPEADPAIRARIDRLAQDQGWEGVHRRLQEVDPVSAERLHPSDPQRLQRALEVFEITGKPISALHQESGSVPLPYRLTQIALYPQHRSTLHNWISERFDHMLVDGFVDEVRLLMQRNDLHRELPSIRCVGYRQIWDYLAGNGDSESMRDKALAATRQLAKRQLTWLRGWPELTVLDSEDKQIVEKIVKMVT